VKLVVTLLNVLVPSATTWARSAATVRSVTVKVAERIFIDAGLRGSVKA
jgi:hypothetical protein